VHLNTSTKISDLGDLGEKIVFRHLRGKVFSNRWDPTGDGYDQNNILTEVKTQFPHIKNNCFAIKYLPETNNFKKCMKLTTRLIFLGLPLKDEFSIWEVPPQHKKKYFKYWNPKEKCQMAGWKIPDLILLETYSHPGLCEKLRSLSTANINLVRKLNGLHY
jgi:hypothetical protein